MKQLVFPLVAAVALFAATSAANADDVTPGPRGPMAAYVDVDGDGINDNAPDHDGDGIINHEDPDYQPAGLGYGRGAKGQFVDENADGINDLAPDDDGDGVPNGQDPDFVRPTAGLGAGAGMGPGNGRGAGNRSGRWSGRASMFGAYVDADGDGINDNALDSDDDGVINCLDDDYKAAPQGLARGSRGSARGAQGGQRGGQQGR